MKCKTTATRARVIFLFSSLLTQVDFAVIRLEVPCKVFMRTARSIKSMVSAAALEEMRHKSNQGSLRFQEKRTCCSSNATPSSTYLLEF